MNHNLKESMLNDCYEYSLNDIAEKIFLSVNTVAATEKIAMEKFKQGLSAKGITIKDLLS